MARPRGISNEQWGLIDDALVGKTYVERVAIFRHRVWERSGGLCGFCGEAVEVTVMHLDHIIPRFHGGARHWDNFQPAHRQCNIGAGCKDHHRRSHLTRGVRLPDIERKQLQVRLPEPVYDAVNKYAQREERSMGAQVAYIVRLWASQLPEPDRIPLTP